MNRKFCIFLFIVCKVAHYFVAVLKIWVIKVVKGLNIINLYAVNDLITGPDPADIQYYAYSMKSLNNFQNTLAALRFRTFAH